MKERPPRKLMRGERLVKLTLINAVCFGFRKVLSVRIAAMKARVKGVGWVHMT